MVPTVSIGKALNEGFANLKANFWPFILIVVILGILDSFGKGSVVSQSIDAEHWVSFSDGNGGLLAALVGIFIKPVFDFGADLLFVKGNRKELFEFREISKGFDSKDLYIDIIIANLMLFVIIVLGFIALILPGIYIACRSILMPYLVIDKGLQPRQALNASWELMRDFWLHVVLLFIIALFLCIFGLALLVIGIFPALALIHAMFASFYQQIIDYHDEEFLLSLGIEP